MASSKSPRWKSAIAAIGLAILVAIAGVVAAGWWSLNRQLPLTQYESPEAHFKYAAIGTESVSGIPYWIWVVLPRLFPEKLPAAGGYTALGLTWEPGSEMPVGFTKETLGIDRVGMNCAACHVGTLRNTINETPTLLLGAPSTKFDAQRYAQFLFDCAADPRFNTNFILPEITYNVNLSPWKKLLYRFAIIPTTKKRLLAQQDAMAWVAAQPPMGPGRTDMNPLKMDVLGLPNDGSVGSTDIMAIWNEGAKEGVYKHSDGLTLALHESVLSSALGTGATLKSVEPENLGRVEAWMRQVAPPAYPYAIAAGLASRGEALFESNCATCHALGGARTGSVIPLEEIKTDPNRADHWTMAAAVGFNNYPKEGSDLFKGFRDTDGYVAAPLDGVWARAPYLHNGSVPNLAALLQPAAERPTSFYRGFDLYDAEKVGFISEGEQAQKAGYLIDTTAVGNGNQGHEFGTQLADASKQALIEYLKTL